AAARTEGALALLQGQAPAALPPSVPLAALALPHVPRSLPSRLLERRPDLAQAAQQLAATDYALDAARAAFMPSIRLAASAGRADASLIPQAVNVFALGGSVLAPLFDAGRLRAQADAAAARRDQAAYAYRKAVLAAFREVEDALAAVALSAQQEEALAQQCDALQDSLALATRRYRAGYAAYLEPLDAQRNLLSAQLALAQVRGDRLAATAALFQSTGGGWQAGATVFSHPKEQP
ncbi:MAG TPA: TolC family protein, partial [Pseudoduganella sp.]